MNSIYRLTGFAARPEVCGHIWGFPPQQTKEEFDTTQKPRMRMDRELVPMTYDRYLELYNDDPSSVTPFEIGYTSAIRGYYRTRESFEVTYVGVELDTYSNLLEGDYYTRFIVSEIPFGIDGFSRSMSYYELDPDSRTLKKCDCWKGFKGILY